MLAFSIFIDIIGFWNCVVWDYGLIEMYDMALEVNPSDAGALYFKSRVYGSWGADGEREECYSKAIELLHQMGVRMSRI